MMLELATRGLALAFGLWPLAEVQKIGGRRAIKISSTQLEHLQACYLDM
jgi:hypothetical protein